MADKIADIPLTGVDTPCHDLPMTTTTEAQTTTCLVRGCGAEFFLVPARGDVKHICLTHGDAYMRANGHQNDLGSVVD